MYLKCMFLLSFLGIASYGFASSYYPLDISSSYTVDGISYNTARDGSFDANGHIFPAEQFPQSGQYTTDVFGEAQIPFLIADKDSISKGRKNIMVCSGQEFDLPKQDCNVLYLLGFAVDGSQDGQIIFIFENRQELTVEYKMMGWNQDVESFEQGEYDFRVTFQTPYVYSKDGTEETFAYLYVNRIAIPLIGGNKPVKMKMASQKQIKVLGMTFSNDKRKDIGSPRLIKSSVPKPAEIAIFAEPKFPYCRMVGLFTPEFMQKQFESAGISASLITEADMNNGAIFNNKNYKALLLLHGNTFPLDCFDAVKNFKQNGGILCTTGVPFTHPVRKLKDLGHSDKYYSSLGIAGFKAAGDRRLCSMPLMQTIGLDHINWSQMELNDSQAMDVSQLPSNTVKDVFLAVGGDIFAGIIYYPDEKSAEVRLQVSPIGNPYSSDEKKVQANLMVSMVAYALDKYGQRDGCKPTSYVEVISRNNRSIRMSDVSVEKDCAIPVFLKNRGDRICPGIDKKVSRYLVFDISKMSLGQKDLLISAQGLINSGSNETMLYLIHREHDRFWLKWMKENGYIDSYEQVESAEQLLKNFGLNKAILLDPKISASLNIATTLAGIKKLLIANNYRVVKEFGLEVKEDLRDRWKSNVEAYSWLIDNYWDQMSHKVLAFIDSSSYVSMPRDYLIANKVFTFWVTGPVDSSRPGADQEAEYLYMSKVLARFPVNIPVLGFPYHGLGVGIGEPGGLPLLSGYGKFLLASDFLSNMTVFTHYPPFKPDKNVSGSRIVKLEKDKVYISMIMSDGDNLCTWNDFFHKFWEKMNKRDFPVGWPMSPTLGDINPVQADYFYRAKKDIDSLGSAVSGIGYIFGKDYGCKFGDQKQAVFDEFFSLTEKYMNRMGFDWLHVMGSGGSGSPVTGKYTHGLNKMDAMLVGYGKEIGVTNYSTSNEYSNGVPVFYMVSSGGTNIKNRINDIKTILPEDEKRPVFVAIIIINWDADPKEFSGFGGKMPDNWILVTPEQLGQLYKQAAK